MNGLRMVSPLVLIMALGYVLRRRGMLGEDVALRMNRLLFYVALPAWLFRSILRAGAEPMDHLHLFTACHVGFVLVPALAWLLALPARDPRERLGVSVLSAIRANKITFQKNAVFQLPPIFFGFKVPRTRLELACPFRRQPLKLVCLPIPPPGQIK